MNCCLAAMFMGARDCRQLLVIDAGLVLRPDHFFQGARVDLLFHGAHTSTQRSKAGHPGNPRGI
jgi:hypothetical protein